MTWVTTSEPTAPAKLAMAILIAPPRLFAIVREGPAVRAADRPVELHGETPLFGRQGASDEDDLYMAFSDALFILERLGAWARRFKIKWRLKMNGDDWGAIDPGGRAGPLVTHMDKWAGRAKVAWSGKRNHPPRHLVDGSDRDAAHDSCS